VTFVTTFVVVGASLAGAKAVETLRSEGFDGRVMLVGDETERPYERPPLSKGYLLGKDPRDSAFVHDASWYASAEVELLLGVRATGLDAGAHTVTLDGFEPVPYDKLLITTGSRPRRLDVPGDDLYGIRYLRTLPDSDALIDRLKPGMSVVVIGAGWIGLETAAAAIAHGATVHIVEPGTLPLRRVLGDELATIYADLHRQHGVTFHFESSVASFDGAAGQLTGVRLNDGAQIPATLAIVGVGIVPNVELASSAGLDVADGIVANASLQTSDPDIYACGDVVSSFRPLLDKHVRVEHWSNALDGGPAAAKAMLGQDVSYDPVPYFYSDQYDFSMEYAGYVEPGKYDHVLFRGDPDRREFIAFWIRDGRVLAGLNANVWDVQDDIQKLVRAGFAGERVDAARLVDLQVPLADLVGLGTDTSSD
jgi:3-phenylpropionate/trans-cinnamate dioxygenase ferredoxin reductase subunit